MDDYESLSHSKWECKYHVVFPGTAGRRFTGNCGNTSGRCFADWRSQKESRVEEGHLMLAAKDDVAAKLAITVSSKILVRRKRLNIQRRLSGIRSRSSLLKSRSGWMKPSRNRTRAMIWELRW